MPPCTRRSSSRSPSALPQAFLNRIADDEELTKKLNAYFHAEYLRERLKLDPKVIVEINNEYGEMDWRVPESQAIYWATMGIKRTPGHKDLSWRPHHHAVALRGVPFRPHPHDRRTGFRVDHRWCRT